MMQPRLGPDALAHLMPISEVRQSRNSTAHSVERPSTNTINQMPLTIRAGTPEQEPLVRGMTLMADTWKDKIDKNSKSVRPSLPRKKSLRSKNSLK